MARYHSSWIARHYGKACQQPLERIEFSGSALTVQKHTVPVWRAVEAVFDAFNYDVHPPYPEGDTGAYNCRQVTGGSSMSPHAWGVAADINWRTNPYIKTPSRRRVNWTTDTDMPQPMIEKIRQITLFNGQRAVYWGGDWQTIKDAMHFQVIVTPAEISLGVVTPELPGAGVKPPPPTPPRPDPTWRLPGDPILELEDAMACLIYQAGADHWQSLIETQSEDAIMKAGGLANRAMVLDTGIHSVHKLTEELI